MHKLTSVWEGVFETFDEAGGDFSAFDSDTWLNKQKERVLAEQRALITKQPRVTKDYPLPLVVAMMLAAQKQVSILDFGGGMGVQYFDLLRSAPEAELCASYHIVEGDATLQQIPPEVRAYKNLFFYKDLDAIAQKTFDLIHLGSVLQYVDDWQGLLKHLATFKPKFLVFSDLLSGYIPTFVTQQIYYEKRIPTRFFNWDSLVRYIQKTLSMRLLYRINFCTRILGSEDFPNSAFPETHRINRPLNAVFVSQ